MALTQHVRHQWYGDELQVRSDGECECSRPATLAHVGFEIVAMTLAEPLRRAFREHLDEHGCGTPGTAAYDEFGGVGVCPEGMRLFRLQPVGDCVIIA